MFRSEPKELRGYVIALLFTLVGLGTMWWETLSGTRNFCALIDTDAATACATAMHTIPAKMLGMVAGLYVLHALLTALGRLVLRDDFVVAKNRASVVVFAVILLGIGWVLFFTESFVAWFFGGS